jgi:hypothetical protein
VSSMISGLFNNQQVLNNTAQVALEAVQQLASEGRRLPAQTWVLDSQPGKVRCVMFGLPGVTSVAPSSYA